MMISRRRLLVAIGTAALATPFSVVAQQRPSKIPRIGVLFGGDKASMALRVDHLRAGLRELGYVEGKNIAIEFRFADGQYPRQRELVDELIKSGVELLVTVGTPATRAAQHATSTIPIVMIGIGDPVASGLVASLSRPGGNITGTTNISPEIGAKRLALLVSTVPKLTRVAVLLNAGGVTRDVNFNSILIAAQPLKIQPVRAEARTPQDLERAFASMKQQRVAAFLVQSDQFFLQQRRQIAELAMRYQLPGIFGDAEYVTSGGLMSYGINAATGYRRAGLYVDKILKGARAGELPVEQPTSFEFAINLKTAKSLGITVPNAVLVQATKVIE